jgi:UDP-N-acetylmuramoylalanine--D-glutamate ligase
MPRWPRSSSRTRTPLPNRAPRPPCFISGDDYLTRVPAVDIVIKSPGIKPEETIERWRNDGKLTSATALFVEEALAEKALVIGITGSKGKSTTSSLIYSILKASGKNVSLVGNIGEPSIAHLDEAKPGKIFVLEMSSYQLMELTVGPSIAVVTSFFPDHLDYHGSLEAYRAAKANIARLQNPGNVVFYAAESEGSKWIAEHSPAEKIPFSKNECPVIPEETALLGEHNRGNIAGAYKAALSAGADAKKALEAIKAFHPLPHRLQSLGTHHGIEWVDDAISTTPESTIAALDALGDRVHTIILGGQDRGYDFASLAERLKRSSVETVILFPGSGPRIREAIEQASVPMTLLEADTMEEAVNLAKQSAIRNPQSAISSTVGRTAMPIVLLSTASPSYNMFKNFEEKGERFKECALA